MNRLRAVLFVLGLLGWGIAIWAGHEAHTANLKLTCEAYSLPDQFNDKWPAYCPEVTQ